MIVWGVRPYYFYYWGKVIRFRNSGGGALMMELVPKEKTREVALFSLSCEDSKEDIFKSREEYTKFGIHQIS